MGYEILRDSLDESVDPSISAGERIREVNVSDR